VLQVAQKYSFNLMLKCLAAFLIGSVVACSDPTPPSSIPEFPVFEVIQRDQPIGIEMVGETKGSSDVPIRARVDGFLESAPFKLTKQSWLKQKGC